MDVSGKTVLVTGATGGLGQAIARTFAGRGARLMLTGRRTDVLEPLASELSAQVLAIDLADADDVQRLIDASGDVDVLIANAALPASGRIESFSVEEIDRALDVNLRAPIVLSRALAPQMAQRGGGHIALMSSLSGKASQAGSSLYSATKFGLRGFGLGLREDWRDRGVGVSVVFPGFIRDAGMFHESGAKLPKGVGTSTPDEVAAAVVKAIKSNRGELDVAPVGMRAGTAFAQLAPEISAKVAKRLGGDKVTEQLVSGQAAKR
jgi:short-subunit dehydrogenase